MFAFDAIVEQRIKEAIERGELDGLPGAGRPLELDDDRMVPEELRLAYRILKNAGFVPPEVQTLREIGELERLVQQSTGETRSAALKKLHLLTSRLGEMRGGSLQAVSTYRDGIIARLA